MDQKNESQERAQPRGHPQQHQGHIPNQEQVGGANEHVRQPANDAESNSAQSQQQGDAKGLGENPNKDHLTLVKKQVPPN
ncbi:hypothetical protein EJD96_11790 [Herbaspirillum seropedicae]|uniref:hypothetical protein n=1 Tax=Herbaspirillum seropedicae TaxID=964 RepID=UPI0011206268|nr:hypothetical protein [Herbaspirillum seropedicae]QDD64796.1 hypothetical protein EJD96_11790 [Herbaspirillum seropedicae]